MSHTYEFKTEERVTVTYTITTDEPVTEEEIFWEMQKYTETADDADILEDDEELVRGSFKELKK